ncbi:unnamed protein product [Rotaria sp. Silwood2]|nr:unnamed protein product [Rotaria sp. Silwood2]CAF3261441.1 unnamed protein product [Rotaria sp. Silwood2]CAF3413758.1 unnamed protein product [Rotaria sp. Silwood2]CAF4436601.1 unnamed protein product [Rotaria sp. Silwood2]CAF4443203.1 unnamed protein product [Rotaria sp. Silwood2]
MILVLFGTVLHQIAAVIDQHPNIWQIVNKDDRLKILTMALKAAGLEEASQQGTLFTVFAPSDAAFRKVPTDIAERLSDPQNKDELAKLLSYHAVGNRNLTSSELLKMDLPARLETLIGDFITVTKQGDQIKINNATIIESDILASNGVIHIIDSVLMPI